MTWEAVNRFGAVIATFSHRDLAEAYRDSRAALGIEVSIRRFVAQRRAA